MTFQEWSTGSSTYEHSDIETFKRRMEYGDAGNTDNKWIAASIAYDAGIQEGLRRAAARIEYTIMRGREDEGQQ